MSGDQGSGFRVQDDAREARPAFRKPTVHRTVLRCWPILCWLLTVVASPAADPPAKVLDLRGWKLTLPVDTDRRGRPDEVLAPDLATFQDPAWFILTPAGDGVVFRANCGGIPTPGAKYARSELREMSADGKERAAWKTADPVRHTMEYTAAVTQLPLKKPEVVCGQIHDADAYLLLVRLNGRRLVLQRNGAGEVLLDADYSLGTRFTVKIEAGGGRIKVWYNGAPKLDWAVDREGCYFKIGCYVQSSPARGDAPDTVAETVVYRLDMRTTPPTGPR